ncbi:hypothetical protein RKD31_000508 [Streptomyces sp. SAI-163]
MLGWPREVLTPPARAPVAERTARDRRPAEGTDGPMRAMATVPRPGRLWRSKSLDMRWQVPRPAPRESVEVVQPSRRAAWTSSMPGPWSSEMICTCGAASARVSEGPVRLMMMRPLSACLTRLVANSVATRAATAVECASMPPAAQAASAATRASRTRVLSWSGMSQTLLMIRSYGPWGGLWPSR